MTLDLNDLADKGEDIPGIESSEQSIVTSEVEDIDPTREKLQGWLKKR